VRFTSVSHRVLETPEPMNRAIFPSPRWKSLSGPFWSVRRTDLRDLVLLYLLGWPLLPSRLP